MASKRYLWETLTCWISLSCISFTQFTRVSSDLPFFMQLILPLLINSHTQILRLDKYIIKLPVTVRRSRVPEIYHFTPQSPKAYCKTLRDILVGIRTAKERGDCPVFLLWLSVVQHVLDLQVGEGVKPTARMNSAFSQHNRALSVELSHRILSPIPATS